MNFRLFTLVREIRLQDKILYCHLKREISRYVDFITVLNYKLFTYTTVSTILAFISTAHGIYLYFNVLVEYILQTTYLRMKCMAINATALQPRSLIMAL